MRNQPVLTYHLPHRVAGTFGASAVGAVAEWMTTSWLRFGVFVSWLWVVLFVLGSGLPLESRLLYIITSPLIAVFLYGAFALAALIGYFIPGMGILFGIIRLGYFRLFSRLIVQEAPEIELPLWRSDRRHS